ncbi:TetR family transcriptional regulator [Actinocatenispora sera]|uniref:TetR family transcriptional regulator n=1 Tax=Actinocatenispora sera TaxID=390989 RepID=UPI0033F5B28E
MPAGPRRTPNPDERQRDAERSQRLLLDAALHEFAAHGYAGTKVADIAARAGVNKQLISYYFGGKEGIYRALHDRWREREHEFAGPDTPLEQAVLSYLAAGLTDPCPARLIAWSGLGDDGSPDVLADEDDEPRARAWQQRGELADDVDTAAVLLAIRGMVMAPVIMPQLARRLFGTDPSDPEFRWRYGETLVGIIRRLARPMPTAAEPAETPSRAE